MPFLIKHFDTLDASYTTTPFNCLFTFQNPITNIKKIYLKSLELPVDITNIRSGLSTFTISYNSTIYSKTLPDNNYTNISTLINDLNTIWTATITNITVLFSVNTLNNIISVKLTGTVPLTFSIIPTKFSTNILGYKYQSGSATGNTYSVVASNQYLLSVDNYIIFNLMNLSVDNNNISNTVCNFKIPLNASNGMVYFENEFSNLSQYVCNGDRALRLSSLKIQLNDRFGNALYQNNNDFSFTLGFDIGDN